MKQERTLSLDITRIAAVLAVVMIHTSAGFVTSYDLGTREFLWGNLFDSASRIGVPLFVMVSGALMLDEDRKVSVTSLLRKNIKNIGLLLAFWSALYCGIYNILFPLSRGESLHWKQIAQSFVMGHFHLWYLYMMIGLYLITPFLRELVTVKNKHLLVLFFVISLLTQFSQPIFSEAAVLWGTSLDAVTFVKKFHLEFFGCYTAYYLLGWYLTHIELRKKWRRLIYLAGALSLAATILYVRATGDYSNGYEYGNLFIFLYSAAVFTALNCEKKWEWNDRLKNMAAVLSRLSFGVYVVHPIFLRRYERLFAYTEGPLLYLLAWFGAVTALSFGVCFAASKIPLVKKLIRT